MSYILEALKRAERERKQGQAPTAFDDMNSAAVPEPAPHPLRRYLPFVALVAIAAAAGAGAVLLLRGPSVAPVAQTPPVPTANAAQAPAVTSPASNPAPATAREEIGAEADARIADDGHIASLNDLTGDTEQPEAATAAARPAAPPPAAAPSAAAPTAARPAAAPVPRAAAEASRPSPPPAAPTAIPRETGDATAAVAPPAAAPGEVVATTPEAAGNEPPPPGAVMPKPRRQAPRSAGPGLATPGIEAIKSLKDMPPAYRSEFPALTIDVLAYTDDPARSFVILGGKRYKAGDNIAEGPHIADIVPEGILFDWHGERVLVPLPH